MPDQIDDWISRFPAEVSHPFRLRPSRLYAVADLYDAYTPGDAASWANTFDQACYRWFFDATKHRPRVLDVGETIAARMHDAGIEHAVDDFLRSEPGKVVGFMGGHDTPRADPAFRQVALMARELRRRGFSIVTGGGPGLMEAANFGAFLAVFDDSALDAQLAVLERHEMRDGPTRWIDSACQVRTALLGDWRRPAPDHRSRSLGIPTWLYGDEPPNLFATDVAKYFYNSVREDGLVSIASGGLIFGPGSAGTVQEVFQNMTINYYTAGSPTPMVFFGRNFWHPASYDPPPKAPAGHPKPVFPLVEKLARDRGHDGDLSRMLLIEDDTNAIVEFLEATNATRHSAMRFAEVRLRHRLAANVNPIR